MASCVQHRKVRKHTALLSAMNTSQIFEQKILIFSAILQGSCHDHHFTDRMRELKRGAQARVPLTRNLLLFLPTWCHLRVSNPKARPHAGFMELHTAGLLSALFNVPVPCPNYS
jgi:hypothetical protein